MSKLTKEQQFDILRRLMGYVQNGSNDSVSMYQDEATSTYHVRVGTGLRSKAYWGDSLEEAIAKANAATPTDT